MYMGQDRDIIEDELKNNESIDSPRAKKKRKKKVQIWVKKETLEYEKELRALQVELLKMQNYVKEKKLKVLCIFEGRDAAGKGGTIKRVTEHLNPRGARVVALEKPSDVEQSQWYFQRYTEHLPSGGEIVLFDRSWYNRAGVEPVMGFCTPTQHKEFLKEVSEFERMLVKSDIILMKFYFSVSKKVQAGRFSERKDDPLKQYKLSPVDQKSQSLWREYTLAKYSMLLASHTDIAPWSIVRSDNKKQARLNCIKHILKQIKYSARVSKKLLQTDPNIFFSGADEIQIMESNLKRG